MGYATLSSFRKLTNINKDTISDPTLQELMPIADRLINKLISTQVYKEELTGDIDSSNTYFRTKFSPICDTNLKNTALLDACNATTGWTEGGDGTAVALTGKLVYGYGALTLSKSATAATSCTWTKTITTAVDGTGRKLRVSIFIKNPQDIKKIQALAIKVGSDDSNYYGMILQRGSLKAGINEIDILLTDMATTGTPVVTALDYLFIELTTAATTDTITVGDIIMDYWRLEDIDSADTSDILVYYGTEDTENELVYGSAQTVSAVLSAEGRVTMSTAPTTTTASEGVFGDYSYVSPNTDWELIKPASCYMLAHLCSFIISGTAPNYSAIEDTFARRDIAGSPDEWLRLCFSLLMQAIGEDYTGIGFRRIEVNDPME